MTLGVINNTGILLWNSGGFSSFIVGGIVLLYLFIKLFRSHFIQGIDKIRVETEEIGSKELEGTERKRNGPFEEKKLRPFIYIETGNGKLHIDKIVAMGYNAIPKKIFTSAEKLPLRTGSPEKAGQKHVRIPILEFNTRHCSTFRIIIKFNKLGKKVSPVFRTSTIYDCIEIYEE